MIRAHALMLMEDYTQKPALRTHMLGVEAAMRQMATYFNAQEGVENVTATERVERWGLAGLLHDFDYEKFVTVPDHPVKGSAILAEQGIDAEIRDAILGHANLPEHPRTTLMAKALFAVDELTGLVMAVTYVRPSKSVLDVEVSSVKKKMKDKTFAAGVNRDDIHQGAHELELDLEVLIAQVIKALQDNAVILHLAGPV